MPIFFRSFLLLFVVCCTLGWDNISIAENKSFVIKSRVNGEIITNFDIKQRESLLRLLNINYEKEKTNVKTLLIDELLQKQFAQSRGILLNSKEIDRKVQEFMQARNLNEKKLRDILIKNNVQWPSFENYISSRLLWKKSVINTFRNEAMIDEHHLNLPPNTGVNQNTKILHLSEIVIPFAEYGKKNSILLANRLKLELNAEADFSIAAKRFSRSETRSNGGVIGLVNENALPKNLKKLLTNLSINEIAEPVIMEESVVLFKLTELSYEDQESSTDYMMTFVSANSPNIDGIEYCKQNISKNAHKILLSELNVKQSDILRTARKYELNRMNKNLWLVLCDRKIQGSIDAINKKKNHFFNNKMIKLSKKLMLQLYREAVIH